MRTAKIARKTNETEISVSINLDGTGVHKMATGIGFSITCSISSAVTR
jgi:imidazoleglycerol-phosphate dehydratase